MFKKYLMGLALSLSALAAQAQTLDLAGAKFEDSVNVAGSPLKLNGAGIRYKAVFKVYAAGLYLGKKTKDVQEAHSQPGPKRVQVTMLREIDANELGKLFSRAIEDEIPKSEFAKVVPSILRMSQMFSDYKTLKTGDTFTVDWVPGKGTVFAIKGVNYGEPFAEPAFFTAMLNIWLGKTPPDFRLKEAMMGG